MAELRRAFVTFAAGGYVELLDIVRPTFENYAAKHGYDYIERHLAMDAWPRPPAWFRIPVLQEALADYDAVLCLGADMIILDDSEDIADHIPDGAINAIVGHQAPVEGFVPSTEMWYLRRAMLPWLARAWELTEYMNHPWWDQAAVVHLMGYNPTSFPMQHVRQTKLYELTHFLPLEWHRHESLNLGQGARFVEATHGSLTWRKNTLQNYLDGLATWA